jgi:indolepyruvate ferredoxin oxidoreductase, beta subunit
MEKNIILAGVGGQGILSIAYVIDNAALDSGFQFKQAEVHGMAQRGGAVQSHLRYSDHEIYSDLVPVGRADLIVSVEPLEALRYWHYLAPTGWVVTSVTPYVNIPDYPSVEQVVDELASFGRVVLVDSAALARAAGNLRAQNTVVVGAASPYLDFAEEQLLTYVRRLFAGKGEKTVERSSC